MQTERLLVSLSMETFTYTTEQSRAKTQQQQQHKEMLFEDFFAKEMSEHISLIPSYFQIAL